MIGVLILVAFVPFNLAFPQQQTNSRPSKFSTRIVGGEAATIKEIPYIIQVYANGGALCGGSIISNYWIVTAGHCMEGLSAVNVSIRAGTDQYFSGGEVIQASGVYVHPKYDGGIVDFDIALIKLASPLAFDSTKSAVTLANSKVAVGTTVIASGWGLLSEDSSGSKQLQKVKLAVVSDDDCPVKITERMICAGYKNETQSTCYGDSGGPLAAGNTLIGITSFGYNCSGISVFSNINILHDWVSSITSI